MFKLNKIAEIVDEPCERRVRLLSTANLTRFRPYMIIWTERVRLHCDRDDRRRFYAQQSFLRFFLHTFRCRVLFPNLESLNLSYCTVTESVVPSMMTLSHRLKHLNLSNTGFSIRNVDQHKDNMAILFSGMILLETLNLQKTNVHNLTAFYFLQPSLKSLNLTSCAPLRWMGFNGCSYAMHIFGRTEALNIQST